MNCRICDFIKKRGLTFLVGLVFAILCFIGINLAMKPVSTSAYCGSNCHEMNTAYQSWELSVHGANKYGIRVECVDCHLPPKDKYFTHLFAKAYAGGKDVYMHHFGGEYDVEHTRKEVIETLPNERCMFCHDDLLKKPSNSAAMLAHKQIDSSGLRCISCHENIGHERQRRIFTP